MTHLNVAAERQYLESLQLTEVPDRRTSLNNSDDLIGLSLVEQHPFCSASDLALHRIFNAQKLTGLLNSLHAGGQVARLTVGRRFQAQHRYHILRKGLNTVRQELNTPVSWQDTASGLEAIFRFLPIVETLNRLVPRLWTIGAIQDLPLVIPSHCAPDATVLRFDHTTKPARFQWLQSTQKGVLTAAAFYRNDDGTELLLPFIWQGLQHRTGRLAANFAEVYEDLPGDCDFWYGTDRRPLGVVIVVPDQLGAMRVTDVLDAAIPAAIIDQTGVVLQKLHPVLPQGNMSLPVPPNPRVGNLANLSSTFTEDPALSTVTDVLTDRVLRWIELFPACNQSGIAIALSHNRQQVARCLASLSRAGLIEGKGGRYELTDAGGNFAARQDRVSPGTVKGRNNTGREKPRHKVGLARLAVRFREKKLHVAPGWRRVMNLQGDTQIQPDLWVLIPGDQGTYVWHTVEFERSATTETDINKKLAPYQIFADELFPLPMLMICETRVAAERFLRIGDDLPMLVSTLYDVLHGDFEGAASVWRYRNANVDISRLSQAAHASLKTTSQEGEVAYH